MYGNNEDHKGDMASPIHKFIKQSRDLGKIKVFKGSEFFLRDFVHVDDVTAITCAAECLIRCLRSSNSFSPILKPQYSEVFV